jgi:hypothetical protein
MTDWTSLETAYGPATNLPDILARLDSKDRDDRLEALRDLEGNVVHQYTVYSASAPVIPLLLERIERGAPDGDALARLLGMMAWSRGDEAAVDAVARAIDELAPRLAMLVDHADVDVRVNLTNLVSSSVRRKADFAHAVARRIRIEEDAAVLLAMAPAPAFGKCADATWLDACRAGLVDGLAARRLACAVALSSALQHDAPDGVLEPLLDAIKTPARFEPAWVRAPWSRSGMLGDLANSISFLGEARRAAALPVLCDVMEENAESAPAVAEAISFMAFGHGAPKTRAELDPVRRAALERIVACERAWTRRIQEIFSDIGFPGTREGLRAWLGIKGTGVIDRDVNGKPLHALVEAHVFAKKEPFLDLVASLGKSVAPLDWCSALVEIAKGAYELNRNEGDVKVGVEKSLLACLKTADKKAARAWVEKELDALLAADVRVGWLNYLLFTAYAAVASTFDAKYDPIVDALRERPYHAKIPSERLEPLVIGALAQKAKELGEPSKGGWGIGFAGVADDAATFLKRIPTARLARAILGLAHVSGIGGDVVTKVKKLGSNAEIKREIAEAERRAAKPSSYLAMREAMSGFADEVLPPLGKSKKTAPPSKTKAKAKTKTKAKKKG